MICSTLNAKHRCAEVVAVAPAYDLTQQMNGMLRVLHGCAWLTDEHMDHSSFLLKRQYPHVDSLHRMSVFESQGCQKVGTPKGTFVQILNLGGQHWITVSDQFCTVPDF